MKEFGVHSAWDVKTMTALFPKAELVRITPKEHGAFVVMQAEISEGFPPGQEGHALRHRSAAWSQGP